MPRIAKAPRINNLLIKFSGISKVTLSKLDSPKVEKNYLTAH